MKYIGIDIGGANTKVASSDSEITELLYIPLWKDTTLPSALKELANRLRPDGLAVVMTGELADCFVDKEEGIKFIMDAVNNAFECEVRYVNNTGNFQERTQSSRELAAANWAASARLIGEEVGDCIFVDVGSTTSDVIPIKNGKHVAGHTDFSRLLRDELFYAGTLRTNLAALLETVDLDVGTCRVSSEFFANTADAYMLLGDIDKELYTCETADGAGKNMIDCMRRLARVVCADLTEIAEDDIYRLAKNVKERQIELLCNSISTVAKKNDLDMIVSAGLGEFMIEEAANRLGIDCFSTADKWGKDISKVFPAYAAARSMDKEKNE
ncbi:hydantoinase/oxoprolinase family protein [Methanococcoides alaskense]|uniref:H4MPT-linked C1 transfer pathway protein n=1 Tax=Methanococcoides alaskense TaxID=325778 RepID=A0AA90TYC6_9EURY|nr:hydantoinase/oxoprolinase family protein [Methanococcoides alaskense]MDA0525111.1 H4MPT-linked C1 transfer pathway protein [Methanococcoides alaskense]MDR6221968.1 putative H4MPT-linked C1 transfer pathway protein [Methanococcoides alaskense]